MKNSMTRAEKLQEMAYAAGYDHPERIPGEVWRDVTSDILMEEEGAIAGEREARSEHRAYALREALERRRRNSNAILYCTYVDQARACADMIARADMECGLLEYRIETGTWPDWVLAEVEARINLSLLIRLVRWIKGA